MLSSCLILCRWCVPFLSVIPTKFPTKSSLPWPTRFHCPNNTSLYILQWLQLVAMQRLCVKIFLSYCTVLNIFLSALTCTQHAYRLPLNALRFTSLHNRKRNVSSFEALDLETKYVSRIVRNNVSSYKQRTKSTTDTVNVSMVRERMTNHRVTLYWVWYLAHYQLSASPISRPYLHRHGKFAGTTLLINRTLTLYQCFSTAGPRPGTGAWHQLYRAARGSPGSSHFSFLSILHE
jgi:hypothetical protein